VHSRRVRQVVVDMRFRRIAGIAAAAQTLSLSYTVSPLDFNRSAHKVCRNEYSPLP
jgi:hypothetical protein